MSNPTGQAAIDSVLKEHRVFPPPEHFSRRAGVPSRARYDELYRRSVEDPEGFWGEMGGRLRWTTRWERVLDWQPPFAKWFVGGRLNIADNCLDRHLAGPRRNKAAIVWEGEPGDRRVLTYHALHREVCRFANVLKALGVRAGGRVGIYLSRAPHPRASPSRSTASTRSSSSTRAAPRASRRASSTPRAATCCTPRSAPSGSST